MQTNRVPSSGTLPVVVPLYKPGRFLPEVLDNLGSCARITGVRIEVYLADDSLEEYPDITDLIGERDWGGVHYQRNPWNLGESANVNAAMRRLKELGCEFALLLHQDDYISPEWLRFCAERARSRSDAYGQLWYCQCRFVDSLAPVDVLGDVEPDDSLKVHGVGARFVLHRGRDALEGLFRVFTWYPSRTLFHLESFLEIGGFYERLRYCLDGDFAVRWLCRDFVINEMPVPMYYRRTHTQQGSGGGLHRSVIDRGYAYIMVRYRNLAGFKRRAREHIVWMRRRLGAARACARSGQLGCAVGQIAALRIIAASFLTCLHPGFDWTLPKSVRELLNHAPPGCDRMSG